MSALSFLNDSMNTLARMAEWGIQQCPSSVNKGLAKATLGFTAATLIGAYYHSPFWLAGTVLGAYVTYKASPYQQLMALRGEIIHRYPSKDSPKKEALKKSYTDKLKALWDAHENTLTPYSGLVNKMIAFLKGGCSREALQNFSIKPAQRKSAGTSSKSTEKAKPASEKGASIEELREKAFTLFSRFIKELDTSQAAQVPEALSRELTLLLQTQGPSSVLELLALQEIIKERPHLGRDLRNRRFFPVTQGNCAFLSFKLRKETMAQNENYRRTRTINREWMNALIQKFFDLNEGYQILKASHKPIAFQKHYELAMHYLRAIIPIYQDHFQIPQGERPNLGTDQDDKA